MGSTLLLVVGALLLVLLNGFFVAAEFGLVKLRQTRVKAIAKRHGLRGRLLAKVHGDLDAYLSACQLGITLASLGLGWIGEPAFASLLHPVLELAGIHKPEVVHAISFFFAFFTISYLHIVVGELAPKSMAIRMSERVGLWTAAPLYLFYWLMYPGIWVLNHSANRVLKLLGLDSAHGHEGDYSPEELKLILRGSRESDDFSGDEWRVLAHSLDFRELDVGDLMRPLNEMVALSVDDPIDISLARMVQTRYSRYPLLDGEGRVLGMIHLKDVFFAMERGTLPDELKALLRPVESVAPDESATALFRRFRTGAPHFAVVVDADELPLGFVTLDNLLAALVGEIRDEYRQSQNEWSRLDDGSLIGKGSLPIFTLERAIGVDIEHDDTADSVGGLVLGKLGELPREGQRIEFALFDVVVKKMNGPRIVLLRVYPKQDEG
ncbi:Hemolysin, contains CBS domains [Andreprevotia lacus DSM 23236]|jgi:CBS domain containing-hemolysin-like protein|uniref:Hemolysin, contains CBS domains n=1 Tax=Andreprevotia lacus DSM 23236 TaxID=1121001 RepID=A0A1W1XQJ9_9NEIS|nr:hemolysin family protein [Andreprevotia lacus]SMC26147.1 Hemolysin, contains CBS domains [Andreprevotia lacus DSM 23236]